MSTAKQKNTTPATVGRTVGSYAVPPLGKEYTPPPALYRAAAAVTPKPNKYTHGIDDAPIPNLQNLRDLAARVATMLGAEEPHMPDCYRMIVRAVLSA